MTYCNRIQMVEPQDYGIKILQEWAQNFFFVGQHSQLVQPLTLERVKGKNFLFIFSLLHRACCFDYFFNIPTHAPIIYTLKSLHSH
jgi:hypothetical protein